MILIRYRESRQSLIGNELEMNWMDLGSKGRAPHVGARLKALDEAVLMAVSDFSCNFVCILSSRFEQCGYAYFADRTTVLGGVSGRRRHLISSRDD